MAEDLLHHIVLFFQVLFMEVLVLLYPSPVPSLVYGSLGVAISFSCALLYCSSKSCLWKSWCCYILLLCLAVLFFQVLFMEVLVLLYPSPVPCCTVLPSLVYESLGVAISFSCALLYYSSMSCLWKSWCCYILLLCLAVLFFQVLFMEVLVLLYPSPVPCCTILPSLVYGSLGVAISFSCALLYYSSKSCLWKSWCCYILLLCLAVLFFQVLFMEVLVLLYPSPVPCCTILPSLVYGSLGVAISFSCALLYCSSKSCLWKSWCCYILLLCLAVLFFQVLFMEVLVLLYPSPVPC